DRFRVLTLAGHPGAVGCAVYSPDGKHIATGSRDYLKDTRLIKVWDAVTGKEVLSLERPGRRIPTLAWSPDSKRLVAGNEEPIIRVWDVETGKEVLTLEVHTNFVQPVAWSPDGKLIATGSGDGTVRLWDAVTGKERAVLRDQNQGPINCVAFS